jgi:predicted nucleic acid-binding protein
LIVLDTNVVSESLRQNPNEAVISWLKRFDVELALPSISIAELSYGLEKLPDAQRSTRVESGLAATRQRYAGRILVFDEAAALAFGRIMGETSRIGRGMSPLDGMIAAIAQVNKAKLATRNIAHFEHCGLDLINPWTE